MLSTQKLSSQFAVLATKLESWAVPNHEPFSLEST